MGEKEMAGALNIPVEDIAKLVLADGANALKCLNDMYNSYTQWKTAYGDKVVTDCLNVVKEIQL